VSTTARAAILAAAMIAPATLAVACADPGASSEDAVAGDEQALTEAKVLAKGVTSPSGLAVAGGHVYFGSNHFVASGDPDLDQQFAYWAGKFSRVPLAGGRQEAVLDHGPIVHVQSVGSKLFYGVAGGCWVGALDTAIGAAGAGATGQSNVYTAAECEPDYESVVGFGVSGDALIVVHRDGRVVTTPAAGGGAPRTITTLRVGDAGDPVGGAVIADGAAWLATDALPTNASGPIPAAIHRVDLASGAATKVVDLAKAASDLTTDGKNVYFTDEPTKVLSVTTGSTAATVVADGFGAVIGLAADGGDLFVADSKRGAVYVVGNAGSGAPAARKKLASVKGIQAITAAAGVVYVGSNVIDGRKGAGIIGAIPAAR